MLILPINFTPFYVTVLPYMIPCIVMHLITGYRSLLVEMQTIVL